MCAHCRLTIPRGAEELCPACAIEARVEARRGLGELELLLGGWAELQRRLDEDDP
jgi:hypothetical protein